MSIVNVSKYQCDRAEKAPGSDEACERLLRIVSTKEEKTREHLACFLSACLRMGQPQMGAELLTAAERKYGRSVLSPEVCRLAAKTFFAFGRGALAWDYILWSEGIGTDTGAVAAEGERESKAA